MQRNNQTLGDVHYWTYGDSTKPTLLLIHGFTGSHEGFEYIIPLLKEHHVIVPDLPGFGVSPLSFRPWTIDVLAKATNDFVRDLALNTPPILISHSLGGLVAASMLEQSAALFDTKTIFISPVATKIEWLDSRKVGAIAGGLQYSISAKTGRFGTALMQSKFISRLATFAIMTEPSKGMRRTIYRHHFDNLNYISSAAFYRDLYIDINRRGAIDYASSLRKFDVLIITGGKDNVTPLKGEKLLAKTINAKLEIIPGVGHLAHYEKPAEIVSAITDFLR